MWINTNLYLNKYPEESGYLFVEIKHYFTFSIDLADGPKGFSLEANLITSLSPSSLLTSSIGLPALYGNKFFIYSGTNDIYIIY